MNLKNACRLFLLMLCFAPSAFAGGKLTIDAGWVRAVPPVSKNTAAYFTIHNGSKKDEVLLHLASDAAETVELHTIVVEPNGAKRMQKVPHATIKAGSSLALTPGGYHLMLIGLKKPLKTGNKVSVELLFQHAGKINLSLPVKMDQGGDNTSHHKHHHH